MATGQYTGLATVEPTPSSPDTSFRPLVPRPTPENFGLAVAQGTEQLGQGGFQASRVFGQIAADDAANQYISASDKILHGDPDRMVQQPDGSMAPDTGYYGLKGADALRQRGDYLRTLDQLQKQ